MLKKKKKKQSEKVGLNLNIQKTKIMASGPITSWDINGETDYHTVALISHASKVMLKILQVRLQQYVNHELPDVQDGFRKDLLHVKQVGERGR